MTLAQYIFYILELFGIAAAALSGAMIAIERRLDPFGVVFVGCITALGGGITRDILMGVLPPAMFSNYMYLLVASTVSIAVFLFAALLTEQCKSRRAFINSVTNVFDAIGLGVFTVSGQQAALNAGFENNAFLVIFVGMITGIGGGMLRDIVCRHIPFVLSKRIYALASLGGAIFFWLIRGFTGDITAAFFAVAVVFTLRMLATVFKWDLPRIK